MHSSRFHSHLRLFILGSKLLQLGYFISFFFLFFLIFLFLFFFSYFSSFFQLSMIIYSYLAFTFNTNTFHIRCVNTAWIKSVFKCIISSLISYFSYFFFRLVATIWRCYLLSPTSADLANLKFIAILKHINICLIFDPSFRFGYSNFLFLCSKVSFWIRQMFINIRSAARISPFHYLRVLICFGVTAS